MINLEIAGMAFRAVLAVFFLCLWSLSADPLFESLGSHQYQERERVTRQLVLKYRTKKEQVPSLLTAHQKSQDPEVKSRLKLVIKAAYFEKPKGFLGIIMLPYLEEGEMVLKVDRFITHSAAQEAGLLRNDLIFAVNGKSVAGNEKSSPIENIQNLIFSKKPGDLIELTVGRNDKKQKVAVHLGLHLDQEREFQGWWEKMRSKPVQ